MLISFPSKRNRPKPITCKPKYNKNMKIAIHLLFAKTFISTTAIIN
jgi:hypothetical protein